MCGAPTAHVTLSRHRWLGSVRATGHAHGGVGFGEPWAQPGTTIALQGAEVASRPCTFAYTWHAMCSHWARTKYAGTTQACQRPFNPQNPMY